MQDARRIGAQIKHFRKLAALSKSDLARRVGVSPTAVHNWEANGVMPRLDTIVALEKALEVDFIQLMTGNEGTAANGTPVARSAGEPGVSRGERLDQFRRQIAALFEVAPQQVEIVVRT